MRIDKSVVGDVVLLRISGSIAYTDAPLLKTTLHRIIREGRKNIVVDCRDMDSLNSKALASLLSVYKQVKGGGVAFANPNPHVSEILRSTHLDDLFEIHGSVNEAIESLKSA